MKSVKRFESLKQYEDFAVRIKGEQFQGHLTIGLAHKSIENESLEKEVNLLYDKYDCVTYQFPKFGDIYGTIYGGENHDISEIFYFCEDTLIRKMIIFESQIAVVSYIKTTRANDSILRLSDMYKPLFDFLLRMIQWNEKKYHCESLYVNSSNEVILKKQVSKLSLHKLI